jgi:hypothetical protein
MRTEDGAAHDWRAVVARAGPAFGGRPPHAVAAIVARQP